MKKFYRVCHRDTKQGLWYDQQGRFTGLIHGDFDFCQHKGLEMHFDPEIQGYLSATDSLQDLFKWFPIEDIDRLQEHGYFVHVYESSEFKFYNRFQHLVIKQDSAKFLELIVL